MHGYQFVEQNIERFSKFESFLSFYNGTSRHLTSGILAKSNNTLTITKFVFRQCKLPSLNNFSKPQYALIFRHLINLDFKIKSNSDSWKSI